VIKATGKITRLIVAKGRPITLALQLQRQGLDLDHLADFIDSEQLEISITDPQLALPFPSFQGGQP